MSDNSTFELVLANAIKLPLVRISRSDFLNSELKPYCNDKQIELAINNNPAYAGITLNVIEKIANGCIKYETAKVTAISAASGLPGGYAMIATVPTDLAQFMAHLLRIMQKLLYLYGWDEILDTEEINDHTKSEIILFLGVMFGVEGANSAATKLAQAAAETVAKELPKKPLTKGVIYPIAKEIAKVIGVKLTKEKFANAMAKIIPVLGALASGGMTYATFKPMSHKLQEHLSTLKFCDTEFYKKLRNDVY